ncbi:hypothetical protein E2C01_004780 [Portunus trituberculatus]|uniref:Uncharacterized protein n=1 Tax=Portunus trituberculatus TaxID=210409 RepID=A0A5B7CQX2_PORTR|nr:hypothetical protein [Portunus trituberculatus]
MAHRTSQSKVNSMLNLDGWEPSSGPLSVAESSGARTKRRLSFLILISALRVLLGSLAVGAGGLPCHPFSYLTQLLALSTLTLMIPPYVYLSTSFRDDQPFRKSTDHARMPQKA